MPAASVTNTAVATTHPGAAMASSAIRRSTLRPPCARGRLFGGNVIHRVIGETSGDFAGFSG
jgi:hypothetical protein